MYKLKNLSNTTFKIMGKNIFPGEEFITYNIQPYQNSIHNGTLQIITNNNTSSTSRSNKRDINKNINNYINQFIINNEKKHIHNTVPIQKSSSVQEIKSLPVLNLFDNNQFNENLFAKNTVKNTVKNNHSSNKTSDQNFSIIDDFITRINKNNDISALENQNDIDELENVKNQLSNINDNLNIQKNSIAEQNQIINNLQNNIIDNIQAIIKDNISSLLNNSQTINSQNNENINKEDLNKENTINKNNIIDLHNTNLYEENIPQKENNDLMNNKEIEHNLNKDEILQSLFHFYLDRNISKYDLENIKQFYNYIGITKNIPIDIQNKITQSTNYEEFITILLNNVYPLLL